MNRWIFLTVAFVASLPWMTATRAAVLERDWKTPGDGLLTYDDVNRREWLDVGVSLLDQFGPGTYEQRYQQAAAETMAGGAFEGFTVADRADVTALAQSAGIDISSQEFVTNDTASANLIRLLGPTFSLTEGRTLAMGFLDELFPPPGAFRQIAEFNNDPPEISNNGSAGLSFRSVNSDFVQPSTVGVMLFRQIPEPATLTSALVAGCLLAIFRSLL